MSKEIAVKTASGTKLYKISQTGSHYYCKKYVDSLWGSWNDIGRTRNFEDALCLVRAHCVSKYGSVYDFKIN